jgi:histidine triad (HIT) family protein
MKNCIFCKIVNKEIPSTKIYEDDLFLAFMDIYPGNKGHSLIITKKHYETFNDIPENELKKLILIVQKISKAIVNATSCHGYNIIMNNKKSAGQTVPHVHFHIIPRFDNDKIIPSWKQTKYNEHEMEEYAKAIRKKIEK